MRRTESISQNLDDMLKENINKRFVLSLQFDESTNYIGTAQLCIFKKSIYLRFV